MSQSVLSASVTLGVLDPGSVKFLPLYIEPGQSRDAEYTFVHFQHDLPLQGCLLRRGNEDEDRSSAIPLPLSF